MPRQRMDREALIRLRKIELDKLNALEGTSRTIVCQVSGGAGSAESFVRCVERFGATRVVGLFADTGFEDPDLHRLLSQLEQHTQCDIVRLGGDRDIWDVFEKSGMMRIARAGNACKASVELKINASAKWLRSTFQPSECVLTTGLGWDEPERAVRFNRAWRPYSVVHPLFWEPRLSHCETVEQLEQYGIDKPRLYQLGYPHNNCGGACILAGLKQWAGVLRDFPERFAYAEERESKFYEKTGFAILRLQTEEGTTGITLRQFREKVEAGWKPTGDFRSSCRCYEDGLTQGKLF